MRYGIIGSRDLNGVVYDNYSFLKSSLDFYTDITSIVTGGGKGVERLVEQWARERDIPFEIVPPNIKTYGNTEAFIHRNRRILKMSDAMIIFWNGKPNAAMHPVQESFNTQKIVHVIPMV